MITATMTDDEIRNELFSEYDLIIRYVHNKYNYYRRTVVKSKKFPIYFQPVEHVSPKNNKYLLFFESRGKNYPDGLRCSSVCLFERGGMNAIMIMDTCGIRTATLYPAHLFSRYRRRFLKDEKLSNLEVIKRYFKMNNNIAYHNDYCDYNPGGKLIGGTKEGVVFGIQKKYNIVVLKTFVSFDTLTKWQSKSVEIARRYFSFIDNNCSWGDDI